MVSYGADLEAKRIEALRNRDGPTYRSLCDALGYNRSALENPELYDSASLDKRSPVQDYVSLRKKPTSVEDLDDPTLKAVSIILEKFLPKAPKHSSAGDKEIVGRLGRISRFGCPVPNYSEMKGPEIFRIYIGLRDNVLQEVRKRGIR